MYFNTSHAARTTVRLPNVMKKRKCTFYLTELDHQTVGLDEERKVYFLSDGWPSDCRAWWRTESVLLIWRRTVRLPDLMKNGKYTSDSMKDRHATGPNTFYVDLLKDWKCPSDMIKDRKRLCMNWSKTVFIICIHCLIKRLAREYRNRHSLKCIKNPLNIVTSKMKCC